MPQDCDPGWLDPSERRAILARQNYECFYCDDPIAHPDVRMDHLYPKSKGGEHGPNNRVASCIECDRRKRNRVPFAREIAKHIEILLREQRIKTFGVAIRMRMEDK